MDIDDLQKHLQAAPGNWLSARAGLELIAEVRSLRSQLAEAEAASRLPKSIVGDFQDMTVRAERAEAERDQMRSNASTAAFDKVDDQLGEANRENEALRSQLVALSAEANKLCGLLGITDDRPTTDALRAAYKEAQARAHAVAVAALPEDLAEMLDRAIATISEGMMRPQSLSYTRRSSALQMLTGLRSRIRTIGPDHLQALEECADVVLEYAPESSWVRNDTLLTRAARRIADIRKAAQEGAV